MKVLYFAWLRTKTGMAEETLDVPETIKTVADLTAWLRSRSSGHAEALGNQMVLRVAVNQEMATPDTPIKATDEVAFFPPVTGG